MVTYFTLRGSYWIYTCANANKGWASQDEHSSFTLSTQTVSHWEYSGQDELNGVKVRDVKFYLNSRSFPEKKFDCLITSEKWASSTEIGFENMVEFKYRLIVKVQWDMLILIMFHYCNFESGVRKNCQFFLCYHRKLVHCGMLFDMPYWYWVPLFLFVALYHDRTQKITVIVTRYM